MAATAGGLASEIAVLRPHIFRARDKHLVLGKKTALMGVVNVTPDSFYEGSRHPDASEACSRALEMAAAGADILDIGGESTRPGGAPVSTEEELRRVLPVLEALRPKTDAVISVDTRRADVAEKALDAGADIINDVSALEGDSRMAQVAAEAHAGVVLMHMKGEPETMQRAPHYDDVVAEVRDFLGAAVARAEASGVSSESVLIDPGIGFGKNLQHNLKLLAGLLELESLGKPILVGTSRKSFIGHLLSATPENRIFGTAASVAAAILHGAHVVRVHDVHEMRDVALVADAIRAVPSPAPTRSGAGTLSQRGS